MPKAKHCLLSFPAANIILVTLNRPKDLNCVNGDGHAELDAIWTWLDAEPNLAVGIITGSGRAFSAGADLKGKLLQSNMLSRYSKSPKAVAEETQNGTMSTRPVKDAVTWQQVSVDFRDAAAGSL